MIKSIFITMIKAYQVLISPFLGNRCRFHPSCSEYMIQAIKRFGVIKGGYLGIKRLARCHPMCEGGLDPVPETYPNKRSKKHEKDTDKERHHH